jgi:hypothetical protein
LELMDAIQALRAKAQSAGTLQTTPEQEVSVTNAIVERSYENQIVYVTNTIVQITPADPQVIYVPVFNPAIVYAPPPTYVFNRRAPLVTFRPGIRAGPIFSYRHLNWFYGGVYFGRGGFVGWGGGRYPFFPAPVGFRPPPFRPLPGWRPPPPGYRPWGFPPRGAVIARGPTPVRWRPDQNRLRRGGSRGVTSITPRDRGWGSSATRPSSRPSPTGRPSPSPGRSGPGTGRSSPGRSTQPGRIRSSNSGLSEMSSGNESRDSSRRGASSRGSSRGSRGNRGGGGE